MDDCIIARTLSDGWLKRGRAACEVVVGVSHRCDASWSRFSTGGEGLGGARGALSGRGAHAITLRKEEAP